jgi:hypothetical protein
MAEERKWKRFENLVAQIQRTLAPTAAVAQNERMRGHESQVLREIDISIRQRVGQYELFIAVDCKDYAHPVDVKDVEAFIGLLKDVRANKGAMVGAHGFTEAARNLARASGVDLYRLVDAEEHEWQTYISIPVVYNVISIASYNLTIRSIPEFEREMPEDYRTLILYNRQGESIGTISSLVSKLWDEERIPNEPGEYEDIPIADVPTYVAFRGHFMGVEMKVNVRVVLQTYYGQLPLQNIKGFTDELNDQIIPTHMSTVPISITDVMQKWALVESRDLLAVDPIIEVTCVAS